MPPDTDMVFSTKGFYKRKDTACAITGICRIHFLVIAWTHWQRFRCFPKQLVWFFIHAYNRTFRVMRHFIDVEDTLSMPGYELFCIFFWWGYTSNRCGEVEVRFFKTLPGWFLCADRCFNCDPGASPPKVGVSISECPCRHRGLQAI